MSDDLRVMAVSQARASHQPLTAGWPGGWKCSACDWVDRAIFWRDHLDEVAVAALDAYDAPKFSSVVHECCERPTEADLRERIAREIEAMADEYRTHDEIDSMQGEVKDQLHAAARIARGQS